jgi:hypothetical protein
MYTSIRDIEADRYVQSFEEFESAPASRSTTRARVSSRPS